MGNGISRKNTFEIYLSLVCSIISLIYIYVPTYLQLQFKIEKKGLDSNIYLFVNIMDGFPWKKIIVSFPHIAEKIFEGLDDQSLPRLGWFKSVTVLSK